VAFLSARSTTLAGEVDRLERGEARLGGRVDELTSRAAALTCDVAADEAAVASAEAAVTSARLNATVDGTDISTIALDAYWRAQQALRLTDPGCRVSWWALAGIGRTESRHGTYLGSEVAPDGAVTPPILGPPLDGTNGFRVVADSDGGALDGDATTDRAVGPMQFLPSTWRTVGRDGTGDGRADPDNVYDAALGAGAYLCRSGDLSGEQGLRAAYLTYNRSLTYVDTVLGFAHGYRDALPLPGAAPAERP
jgi:membrane-bound lytic murein transglycosylase B